MKISLRQHYLFMWLSGFMAIAAFLMAIIVPLLPKSMLLPTNASDRIGLGLSILFVCAINMLVLLRQYLLYHIKNDIRSQPAQSHLEVDHRVSGIAKEQYMFYVVIGLLSLQLFALVILLTATSSTFALNASLTLDGVTIFVILATMRSTGNLWRIYSHNHARSDGFK